MFRKRFYYLIKLQYLGFRYHGWQKQPNQLTVERMVSRTLSYVLERKNFKLLAMGRTDAKVSANMTFVELFLDEAPLPEIGFLELFNKNLPQDIKALSIEEVDEKFNIIQHPKIKEYLYLFSFGEKNHPFCAPYMINILEDLDIAAMQAGAKILAGHHNFKNYAYKASDATQTVMHLVKSEIVPNTVYTANFFPKHSYIYRVHGAGFKRYQVRLMMGALFELGMGNMTLEAIRESLNPDIPANLTHIAQPSGLILQEVDFEGWFTTR